VVRLALVVLFVGCGRIGFDALDLSDPPDSGADATQLGPFGVPSLVMTGGSDANPSLPASMLELYFQRGTDIFVATRATTSSAWGAPALVAELSSAAIETSPEITPDGLTIFFASARGGGAGSQDIYFSVRGDVGAIWSAPERVGELCTVAADTPGTATDTDIYFDSNRNGTSDLFHATRSPSSPVWNVPELLDISGAVEDGSPFVSADGLAIYFDSAREGDLDLYVAVRASTSDPFGTPAPIVELNLPTALDSDPWLSPDGRHLFFRSNRDGTSQIYEATR
jgi:Tol biopolymer transport system component